MNTFERELRRMFQDSDVINNPLFCGNCMIGELDDDLKIKVVFSTGMHAENYSMLYAKIINRTEGVVDSERFVFNDILDGKPVVKGTNRLDIIHLWTYSGEVEWYGYQPNDADIRKIADAVESYASIFQSDNMTMSM